FNIGISFMSVDDRSWMYEGWNDNGCHSEEWARNTNAFLDRAFSGVPNGENCGIVCPCAECRNRVRRRKSARTFGSANGVETPEETLSRIAYGGFGGRINVTTSDAGNGLGAPSDPSASGGGNYSPPQVDNFSF
ncbi:hypothetical protein EJB05_12720, partial [Eragrostis curvula]